MADTPADPKITRTVFNQFNLLRNRGVNMLDMNAVYTHALQAGFMELSSVVLENLKGKGSYLQLLTRYKFYKKLYAKEDK